MIQFDGGPVAWPSNTFFCQSNGKVTNDQNVSHSTITEDFSPSSWFPHVIVVALLQLNSECETSFLIWKQKKSSANSALSQNKNVEKNCLVLAA